jgi:methionyl-tRNA formyltransferase
VKLVFFGSGDFALSCLRMLAEAGHAPVLVVTAPPRRRRRGGGIEPTAVQAEAERAGLDTFTPEKVNAPESLERLRAAGADLFTVSEYGQIMSEELLAIPGLGAINVHGSLLPRHRGATPVAAAILAGDDETGVTIQRMVKRMDAGPILATRSCAIEPDEDAGRLAQRLAPLGGALLVEVVTAFVDGHPPPDLPQAEADATYCYRLRREDGVVDWKAASDGIERHVRAMTPKPGAHTELVRDDPLGLVLRRVRALPGSGTPGEVVAVGAEGFDVGAGSGLVRVLELVPASRKAMSARDFVNGYRLTPGARLR